MNLRAIQSFDPHENPESPGIHPQAGPACMGISPRRTAGDQGAVTGPGSMTEAEQRARQAQDGRFVEDKSLLGVAAECTIAGCA